LSILRSMRSVVDVPLAAQPAAFRTTDETPCFTKIPEFPDELETVQTSRQSFTDFAVHAHDEGIGFLGGCCGCNATYIRAMRRGLNQVASA
ncbi:MAG TPA: homocysteine S-methyltransferase family protein, partial [Thermomicrobiales bacterium]|nr:homocysteine S-methyltransferase family protein [Thermomicrobiales bacterium]